MWKNNTLHHYSVQTQFSLQFDKHVRCNCKQGKKTIARRLIQDEQLIIIIANLPHPSNSYAVEKHICKC